MIIFVFIILMLVVFGKMLSLCIRAAWGLTKIIFRFMVLPIVLIALMIKGFTVVWMPILVIIGLMLFIRSAAD